MATSLEGIDISAARAKQQLVAGFSAGAAIAGVVYLGDVLGIYRAMAGKGPLTSEGLALAMGLQERWLREWLQQQAAAGILDYRGEGCFELSTEAALVVVDEANPFSMIGSFTGFPERMGALPHVAEAFRTGVGFTIDGRGPEAARVVERMLAPMHRTLLVQTILPASEGLVARLEVGAVAADVGCGAGIAMIEMAKAFPRSTFHGYDISTNSLARGAANVATAGIANVFFHEVPRDGLPPTATYDLVTTFDCLHDMTDPASVAGYIRSAIKDDGTWIIADINGAETFEENLKNRLAAVMYASSIAGCLPSGLSEAGGAGLGTLGLPEPRMRDLVLGAGFSRFRRLAIEHPVNAYYEARP